MCSDRLAEIATARSRHALHNWRGSGAIFDAGLAQRPAPQPTDFSNISCSALLRSISMMRSTPPAPITTGTPT